MIYIHIISRSSCIFIFISIFISKYLRVYIYIPISISRSIYHIHIFHISIFPYIHMSIYPYIHYIHKRRKFVLGNFHWKQVLHNTLTTQVRKKLTRRSKSVLTFFPKQSAENSWDPVFEKQQGLTRVNVCIFRQAFVASKLFKVDIQYIKLYFIQVDITSQTRRTWTNSTNLYDICIYLQI